MSPNGGVGQDEHSVLGSARVRSWQQCCNDRLKPPSFADTRSIGTLWCATMAVAIHSGLANSRTRDFESNKLKSCLRSRWNDDCEQGPLMETTPHSLTASAHGEPISVAPQFVFPLLSTPLGQAYLKGNVSRCC
jgi:hypothetical protein